MKKIKALLLDLLFPPRCAVCEEVTPISTAICPDCIEELRAAFKNASLCPRCGKPGKSCVCGYGLSFKRCISAFEYCDKTANIFKILKTDADSPISAQLAELMTESFCQSDMAKLEFDCITFVPTSKRALEQKGFDHAEMLAQKLSLLLSVPCVPPPIIRKDESVIQHTLSSRERLDNAKKSYMAAKDGSISGRVLLVDDIITTGATLDSCSSVLLSLGAKEVYCITAATTLLS